MLDPHEALHEVLGRRYEILEVLGEGGTGTVYLAREQFLGLFLEMETWSDYKRTCLPARVPAPGHSALPGRFLYSQQERQTNSNIPPPEQQPERNDNDPQPCTP
jgi:serine/threonine protein kinase